MRWATLTPDLGLEWRICPSCGIAVNGSWTSWTWSDKDRRYALWEVAPEIRYYMGEKKAWYLGAMFKAGQFNYKISETGKQGDLMGGGITTGYQLRLNKALTLDFNLGLGYLNADYVTECGALAFLQSLCYTDKQEIIPLCGIYFSWKGYHILWM